MKLIKYLSLSTAAGFALLASNPALADGHSETEAAATAEAKGGPALWKVADEDTTIYMFGTVHMLPDDVDWNSGVVNEALASAETLVTELNMTPEIEAEIGKQFEERGLLPEGQTLRSLMTEEQLATYEAGMVKVQMPAETFDQLEPWLASIVLLQIVTQAAGFTADKGVETVLEAAIGPDVGREALETVESQILVFDELPLDQQMIYFLEFAADPVEGIQGLNAIVSAWAEGDAEGVGKMMNEALAAHPDLQERLLFSRNKNWAEWIDTRLDTPGTVFMAVGAGHLAGENSVQDYLTERGIITTRVQ
jgi:uncharacterized protein YbaP (TraB family)